MAGQVRLERPVKGVGLVVLDRPERLNALSDEMLLQVAEALEALAADPGVRVAVLTGSGRAFAAGADLAAFAEMDVGAYLEGPRISAWRRIWAFEKPLLAAVEGHCLGGGFELALAADLIVAGEGARFGQPEVNLGLMPGAGGVQRLVRLLGYHRALAVLWGERTLDAHAAWRHGIVHRVVPRGATRQVAVELAGRLSGKAPLALRAIKGAARVALEAPLSAGIAHDYRSFAALFATRDAREGIRAFLEGRRPVFEGRGEGAQSS